MALSPRSIIRLPAPALRGAGSVTVRIDAKWLDPVTVVANTGAYTDYVAGKVHDGITLVLGDTFLFQPVTGGMSAPSLHSGIYVVPAAGATPARRPDANTGAEIFNAAVRVIKGTAGKGTAWINVNSSIPIIGESSITFRYFDNATPTPAEILPVANSINSYADSASVIATVGYAATTDAGGSNWRRTGSQPHPTFLPNYFRRQDVGGNWYEAVTKSVLYGEQLGIIGDGADVHGALQAATDWLATKGGGRLILPEGIVQCNGNWVIDHDSIWVQGAVLGNQANGKGTLLRMGTAGAIFLGGDSASSLAGGGPSLHNESIKFSDMAIDQLAGNKGYVFISRDVSRLRFRDLQVRGVFGFHSAGNLTAGKPGTMPNYTRYTFYENIEGDLTAGAGNSANFLYMVNSTHFWMANVNIEGAGNPGSALVNVPQTAAIRPQNMFMTNVSCGNFDRGLDIRNGVLNLYVSNSLFDRIKTFGASIIADNTTQFVRFSNCNFNAAIGAIAGSIGLYLAESVIPGSNPPATYQLRNTSVENCHFAYWGRNAVRVANSCFHVSIANSQFEDISSGTASESVIYLGADTNYCKVVNNQIFKNSATGALANKPLYGVRIDSIGTHIQVMGNQISNIDPAGKAILNPNRASSATRKIQNNTDQLLEGTTHQFQGWYRADVTPGLSNVNLALFGTSTNPVNYVVPVQRFKIVGVWVRLQAGAVTGGSIQIRATVNGVAAGPTVTLNSASGPTVSAVDLSGAALGAANQVIGMQISSPGLVQTGTIDVHAGLVVYYD